MIRILVLDIWYLLVLFWAFGAVKIPCAKCIVIICAVCVRLVLRGVQHVSSGSR
jgi:hypothetical protein